VTPPCFSRAIRRAAASSIGQSGDQGHRVVRQPEQRIDDADQPLEGANVDGDGLVEFFCVDVLGGLQRRGVNGGVKPEINQPPTPVDRRAEALQARIVADIQWN
jgi:hypothetical protein